jgi:hypothetical protein
MRPSLADSLVVNPAERDHAASHGAKSGQDFLSVLDKTSKKDQEKPGHSDKQKPLEKLNRSDKPNRKLAARAERDLSRVKAPKLNTHHDGGYADGEVHNHSSGTEVKDTDELSQTRKASKPTTIKDVMKANKSSIEDFPIIAFLTGQLEKLDAPQIPSLVAGSDFVQSALSEADIGYFMQQPMKVSQLFESLGLPQNLMDQAISFGIDLEAVITPQKFFKDLGIDPQRISVELQLLRDNLGLGGLSEYMRRAQNFGFQDDVVTKPTSGSLGAKGADVGQVMDQSKIKLQTGNLENVKAPSLVNVSEPQTKQSNSRLLEEKTPLEETSILGQGPQNLAYVLAAQEWLRNLSDNSVRSEALIGQEDPGVSISQSWPEGKVMASVAEQINSSDHKALGPTTNAATFDVWRTLGETLKSVDTETVRFDTDQELPTQPSNLPQMADLKTLGLDKGFQEQSPDAVLRAPWIVAQENMLKGQVGGGQNDAADLGMYLVGNDSIPRTPSTMTDLFGEKGFSKSGFGNAAQEFISPKIDLGLEGEALNVQPSFESSRSGSRDSSSGFEQPQGERGGESGGGTGLGMETVLSRPSSLDRGAFESTSGQFADAMASSSSSSPMTPSQRAHLVQQVIDRTAMLSSQGGGSIRLDLSSADLGRMELAVAMDEGRVNLRVLTGSDGMRSAILSDMTRLKEALGLQNIQLGQVDVGVAGQQTSNGGQGFGGQSSFNQSRNFSRDDFDRSLAQTIGSRNISRPAQSEPSQMTPLSPAEPLIGNGRISLRI